MNEVSAFWREIGVVPPVLARAEEVLRENETLFAGLPLHEWRTVSYEEELSALKGALGEDADGMKLFVAQSMEALLALREYEERGIGREIFRATMAFMARFSGEALARAAGNLARNEPRAPLFGTLFCRVLGGGQPRLPRLDLPHGGHGARRRSARGDLSAAGGQAPSSRGRKDRLGGRVLEGLT